MNSISWGSLAYHGQFLIWLSLFLVECPIHRTLYVIQSISITVKFPSRSSDVDALRGRCRPQCNSMRQIGESDWPRLGNRAFCWLSRDAALSETHVEDSRFQGRWPLFFLRIQSLVETTWTTPCIALSFLTASVCYRPPSFLYYWPGLALSGQPVSLFLLLSLLLFKPFSFFSFFSRIQPKRVPSLDTVHVHVHVKYKQIKLYIIACGGWSRQRSAKEAYAIRTPKLEEVPDLPGSVQCDTVSGGTCHKRSLATGACRNALDKYASTVCTLCHADLRSPRRPGAQTLLRGLFLHAKKACVHVSYLKAGDDNP